MGAEKKTWVHVQMLTIAAVFFGPLIVAGWMYYTGSLQPEGRSNHGALLQPIVNLTEELPQSALLALGDGQWQLLHVETSNCAAECRDALYTMRQARKMLGNDMSRLLRVFLHGDSSPDTVFLADEHAGLITLSAPALAELLHNKKPATMSVGGYFLIDPLGNLVMYFQPEIDPGDMVEDIKHLLELSRIG